MIVMQLHKTHEGIEALCDTFLGTIQLNVELNNGNFVNSIDTTHLSRNTRGRISWVRRPKGTNFIEHYSYLKTSVLDEICKKYFLKKIEARIVLGRLRFEEVMELEEKYKQQFLTKDLSHKYVFTIAKALNPSTACYHVEKKEWHT